jgi:hypothetical protein
MDAGEFLEGGLSWLGYPIPAVGLFEVHHDSLEAVDETAALCGVLGVEYPPVIVGRVNDRCRHWLPPFMT